MDQLFRDLANHVDEGVFVIRDRLFIFANVSFARMLGRHLEEVLWVQFTDVIAPEDVPVVADRYQRRWAGESVPSDYELHFLHRDGETRVPVRMWATIGSYEGAPATLGVVRLAAT